MTHGADYTVERLAFEDVALGELDLAGGALRFTLGLGSGLARRESDAPGCFWAVCDRGPNLPVDMAIERYGQAQLGGLRSQPRAKIMPRSDLGPALVELQLHGSEVVVVRVLPLRTPSGRLLTGLPPAEGPERAFDLHGLPLAADEDGVDSEGVAALPDGGFIVSEEYGPSLLKLDANGVVAERWIPRLAAGAAGPRDCPVRDCLPGIASRRTPNRGFEALSASPDGRSVFVAFQSPLSLTPGLLPGVAFARLWRVSLETGAVVEQHLYPLDPPESFVRDAEAGPVDAGDLKICESVCLGPRSLLILERISRSAKIYRVDLDEGLVDPMHWDEAADPLEVLSLEALRSVGAVVLKKTLLLSTDIACEIDADLEGMVVLSPHELLLVNDNDFGVEGTPTRFFRVRFRQPILQA